MTDMDLLAGSDSAFREEVSLLLRVSYRGEFMENPTIRPIIATKGSLFLLRVQVYMGTLPLLGCWPTRTMYWTLSGYGAPQSWARNYHDRRRKHRLIPPHPEGILCAWYIRHMIISPSRTVFITN